MESLSKNSTILKQANEQSIRPDYKATQGTIEGLRLIAINVIGFVGYGARHAWTCSGEAVSVPAGYKLTFMEATLAVVNDFVLAVVLPDRILHSRFVPKMIKTLGEAKTEFPQYARSFIAKEQRKASEHVTLMSALVQKMHILSPARDSSPPNQNKDLIGELSSTISGLSENEVIGNLFNFKIAGFDTTASTMAYAIMALALEPHWQDWIIEEIDKVSRTEKSEMNTCFETDFSQLTRCLAIMVSFSHTFRPSRQTRYLFWFGDLAMML